MRFARPTAAPPFEDALHPLDKNDAQKAKIKVKSVQVVDEVESQRCESGKIVHVKQTHTHIYVCVVHVCVCGVCVCERGLCQSLLWCLVTLQFACFSLFKRFFKLLPPSSVSQSLPV